MVAFVLYTSRTPGDPIKVDVDCSCYNGPPTSFGLVSVFRLVKVDADCSCCNGPPTSFDSAFVFRLLIKCVLITC